FKYVIALQKNLDFKRPKSCSLGSTAIMIRPPSGRRGPALFACSFVNPPDLVKSMPEAPWKTHRTREILITTLFIMKAFLEIILGHFSVHQGYRIGLYFSRNGVSFEYYRKVPTTVSTGIFWISRLLLICFDEVHAEFRCAGRLYFVNGFIQLILI